MSKVVTTTVLPDVAGGSVTLGGTGDSVVVTGNDIRANVLQDAGGNAVFTSNGSGVLSGVNSGLSGAMKLIRSQTASNSANITFATNINSTYDVYIFRFMDIGTTVDGPDFLLYASIDGGTSYGVTKTTTTFRTHHNEADNATNLSYQAAWDQAQSTNAQVIVTGINDDADAVAVGEVTLFAPSSTTYVKHFLAVTQEYEYSNYSQQQFTGGYYNTTSAINAIKFQMSSGNINTGTIKLYGISKS